MKLLSPTGGSQIVGFTGPLRDKFTLLYTVYIYLQTCKIRRRLGCVNPASWLTLAAGASSRNLAFTFSCMSVDTYATYIN